MGKAEVETVEVTIRVPKPIIDFLNAFGKDIRTYLENSVAEDFRANFEAFKTDPQVFMDLKALVEKYKLKTVPEMQGCIKDKEA